MVLNALALICTFFIMRVYHHSSKQPVPRWAQVIFLCQWGKVNKVSSKNSSSEKTRRPSNDEELYKGDWEMLAKRLDKIAFACFLSLYILLATCYFTYLNICRSGGKICMHPTRNIFEVADELWIWLYPCKAYIGFATFACSLLKTGIIASFSSSCNIKPFVWLVWHTHLCWSIFLCSRIHLCSPSNHLSHSFFINGYKQMPW